MQPQAHTGSYYAATVNDVADFAPLLGEQHERLLKDEFPHEVRMLSRDETRDTIGTSAYIGALLNMANGHLHPLKMCVGEARAAASLGATIYEQSPVLNIEKGGKPRVVTQRGSITADAVAGTLEQFDLFANVKPLKIPGAHLFSKPMVALGVLFYQIKDRL